MRLCSCGWQRAVFFAGSGLISGDTSLAQPAPKKKAVPKGLSATSSRTSWLVEKPVAEALRAAFQDVVREPPPPRLQKLIEEIRRQEHDRQKRNR